MSAVVTPCGYPFLLLLICKLAAANEVLIVILSLCSSTYEPAYVILFSNLMHYFFIKSIVFLYMFRPILCSSSGGLNCIYTASGS